MAAVSLIALLAGAMPALAQNNNSNKKPTACFTQSPSAPTTGQAVTFNSSCSKDSDGRIAGRAWELDNTNDFNDGSGVTVTRTYARSGSYVVKLGVIDDDGAVATVTKTITIANRSPIAGFSFSPANPTVGQTVTLTSTSGDPDGSLASQNWDLDGDGQFDDASGPSASYTPATAGSHPVGIRVVDDKGTAAVATKTFDVAERPAESQPQPTAPAQGFDDSQTTSPEPPAVVAPAPLRWLDPFPIVRIRGRTTRTGVLIGLFTVRAPAGARIELRCSGKGCPRKPVRKLVEARGGKPAATIRFRSLEGRLGAGARVKVLVTEDGLVGKYTQFKIRRLKVPVRTDRCLMPGSGRPVACPATS